MNRMLTVLFCISFFVSCTGKKEALNMLSDKEEKEGWICLFNGKDFTGWRGHSRNDIPKVWAINDESIMIQSQRDVADRDAGSILYDRKFRNFELRFDWKVSKGANSGVFYLAQEGPGLVTSKTGLEYQVLDNENHPDAKKGKDGNRTSAAMYDLIPPVPQNAKPYGEWNTGAVIFDRGKVSHYQNGEKVLEAELWTDEWKARVEDSKFNGLDDILYAGKKYRDGYIVLQDHKDDVWFRNIKIRSLD